MSSASPVNSLQPPPPPTSSIAAPASTSPRATRSPLISNNLLANRPSAQLASMLAESLRENEQLKRELMVSKRNAEKYERMVSLANSPSSSSSPSFPDGLTSGAIKRFMEFESKLERAESEKDESFARLKIMQEIWGQLDAYLSQCELRAKDAREGYNKIFQEAGGKLQPLNKDQLNLIMPDIPFPNTDPFPPTVYLPPQRPTSRKSLSRPHHRVTVSLAPPAPAPAPLQPTPTMVIPNNTNGTSLPSFSLPPHPHPVGGSSRVRPRADSMDGSGGPPPQKRSRDGFYRDDVRRLSHSPTTPNTLAAHNPRQASSSVQPPVHQSHPQQIRDERSRRRRLQHHNDAVRGRSPRRPSSRSSSASLDEMLLEASSNHHENQQPMQNMFTYPQPQPHPNLPGLVHPPPSPSPPIHSSVNSRSVLFQGQSQGGSLHSYQTHIFAPPVTGAPPVKKSSTSSTISNLSRGGSLAGNPHHHGHHGVHVLGPGGYPPTNAQGQRICRQCGLVGRYKDGKSVEKWGPGPEGPGTVCDKCRKKMKRVERRGTMESQQQREQREQHQQVQQALAHHRSQQQIHQVAGSSVGAGGTENNVVPGQSPPNSTSGSSIRRTDTVVVGPGIHYDHQRISSASSRPEDLRASSLPGAPHIRSDVTKRPDVLPMNDNDHPLPGRRPAPTPPYIATLPGSNENDEEAERESERRMETEREREFERRGSSSSNASSGGGSVTPNRLAKGGDIDADGDDNNDQIDIDRDADGDEDAEADLLEAVDAAEEARKEKSSGESSAGDEIEDSDQIIKMEIEEDL